MARKTDVLIIGCGWLGLPLAGHFLSQGLRVSGTCTQVEKLAELKRWGIDAYLFRLGEDPNSLPQAKSIIITPPPNKVGKDNYADYLSSFLSFLSPGKSDILFTSSTSVYLDSPSPINEDSPCKDPSSADGYMVKLEQQITRSGHEACIVRLGGLIGPSRHPGNFLSGKTDLKGASEPVNYLSLEDACRFILELALQKRKGIFNLVCPSHPSREEFYTYASSLIAKTPGTFKINDPSSGGKIVNGQKAVLATQCEYLNSDWRRYLQSLQRAHFI